MSSGLMYGPDAADEANIVSELKWSKITGMITAFYHKWRWLSMLKTQVTTTALKPSSLLSLFLCCLRCSMLLQSSSAVPSSLRCCCFANELLHFLTVVDAATSR